MDTNIDINIPVETPVDSPIKTKRKNTKKADLNTRIGRYYINKTKGMTKKDAAILAGYPDGSHVTKIEKTDSYLAVEGTYKSALLKQISLDQVAEAHVDNITQDKDRGARNKAIEMFKATVEPDNSPKSDDSDKIMVILR